MTVAMDNEVAAALLRGRANPVARTHPRRAALLWADRALQETGTPAAAVGWIQRYPTTASGITDAAIGVIRAATGAGVEL